MTAPMRLRRYLALLTLLAISCVSAAARAQISDQPGSTLAPSAPGSGGIRLGQSLVLHLAMGLEVGWDSNIFFEPDTATIHPSNAFYLRLNPSFNLTTRPRQASPPFQFDF